MSENKENPKDSDVTEEAKAELVAGMDRYAATRITSWDDLYTMLLEQTAVFLERGDHYTATHVINVLSLFVHALRDLPEESDALVIVKHINRLMIMEPERTGLFKLTTATKAADALSTSALGVLASVLGSLEGAAEGAEEGSMPRMPTIPLDGKKRTLH